MAGRNWDGVGIIGPGLGILLVVFCAAASGQAKATEGQAAGESMGAEACAGCHKELAAGFATSPHSKMALIDGKAGIACESCHGPGKAHVDRGGDAAKIFNPAKATAKEVDAKCMTCHEGQHAKFERSAHSAENVSCTKCHAIHEETGNKHLLAAAEPALCYECHDDVKPQFSMPFRHKVNEGLVRCSDCHDAHGSMDGKGLKAAAQQDAVCSKCHKETAGPFVYEHAATAAEGCTACHAPHGGENARLLKRANVNAICQGCHAPAAASATGKPIGPGHDLNQQKQPCTECHTGIHGSNSSPALLRSAQQGTARQGVMQ